MLLGFAGEVTGVDAAEECRRGTWGVDDGVGFVYCGVVKATGEILKVLSGGRGGEGGGVVGEGCGCETKK